MLGLKKVAITGSIASGKSTVCDLFRTLGAEVVSADDIVHQLLSNDSQTIEAVAALLGQNVFDDTHHLDRSKIAKAVFNNPKLLKSLEKILHPIVKHAIDQRYAQACTWRKTPLFIAEIPLLFESGADHDFDAVICVVSSEKRRKEWYLQKHSFDDFNQRQQFQWNEDAKAKQSDIILKNDGTLEELRTAVEILFKQLTSINQEFHR